jgi:hypothetical protein
VLRALTAAAAGALALTTVPALAATEPAVLEACDAPAGAVVLTTAGVTRSTAAPATPTSFSPATTVVVDLAGSAVGTTGDVVATLTWGIPVNDYDLRTTNGTEVLNSQNLQPVDEPLEEIAVGRLAHCSTFTVQVRNWVAPVVVDVPQLALSSRAVKPPKA